MSIAERHATKTALLFFDVDDFKYINDAYGHPCGDELLVKIVGNIATLVRKEEMFCRLGGDEFAILLPETDVEGATKLAVRINSAISKIHLPVKDKNLFVTSSIGIAVYPD
ncbi:MAG: diguanylate cyclase, partial [Gammaproteobacteria bacterium]|nr:diguanylate cyclase [Gammaproteobacteria bacterium]